MADLFDALVARALGTASALAPVLAPRFAPPLDERDVDDEPPDLTPGTPADQAQPGERRTPEPAVPPVPLSRRAEAQARNEPAPAATLTGRDRPLTPPTTSTSAYTPPRTEPAMHRERPEPRALTPSQPVPPAPAQHPRTPDEPLREHVPAAPVEVHREPGQEPSPDLPRPATEPARDPIDATPMVGAADPAAQLDEVHVAPTARYETPAAPVQVTVSIGYVEVRAPVRPTSPAPPPQPRWPQPRLSLQDYLRRDERR